MRKNVFATALISIFVIQGCASFNAEPCSDYWFDREAQEAFRPIRNELRPTLRDLRSAQEAMDNPSFLGAWRTVRALDNLTRLAEAFEQKSLPRLQAAADQCEDTGFVRRAIFDFLEEEGIEDVAREFDGIEALFSATDS